MDRFWSKVDIKGDNECWNYKGVIDKSGYGRFGSKKPNTSHRRAFLYHYGYLPTMVLHHCDNRICCNPKHLYEGDSKKNMIDMSSRKRQWAQKIDPKDVPYIRTSSKTGLELAKQFNVSQQTICDIRKIRKFRYV